MGAQLRKSLELVGASLPDDVFCLHPLRTAAHAQAERHVIKSRSALMVESFLAGVVDSARIHVERVRVFTASTHPQPLLTGIHAYLLAGIGAAGPQKHAA